MTGLHADGLNRRVLDALQDDIPLIDRPWDEIGARLGIPGDELLERVCRLHASGMIRTISPVLEPRAMGVRASTLVALPLPADRVADAAAEISRSPAVSHNILRDHPLSLWFTFSAPDTENLERDLAALLAKIDVPAPDALELRTVRKFKADVRFPFIPAGMAEVR